MNNVEEDNFQHAHRHLFLPLDNFQLDNFQHHCQIGQVLTPPWASISTTGDSWWVLIVCGCWLLVVSGGWTTLTTPPWASISTTGGADESTASPTTGISSIWSLGKKELVYLE